MASGDSRLYKGAYVATGSGLSIDSPGFKPRWVMILNSSDASVCLHIEGQPDASFMLVKGSATTWVTTAGITLDDAGFDVGTNADLNTSGEVLYYVCGS